MFGQNTNPLAAYQKVETDISVDTASPHQLIVMLYDGAISAVAVARQKMVENNYEGKGLAISKAIDIIANGLKVSLDIEAGGEIAQNLAALYDYMVRRLVHANLKNQVAALDEVAGLLGDIRSAWVEIRKAGEPGAQP